eukprot:109644_1
MRSIAMWIHHTKCMFSLPYNPDDPDWDMEDDINARPFLCWLERKNPRSYHELGDSLLILLFLLVARTELGSGGTGTLLIRLVIMCSVLNVDAGRRCATSSI